MPEPLILAIDTSCDETCAAISCGRKILSNVIDSQINIHAQYGGVVPFLAKRAHEAKIEFVVKESLTRSHLVNAIAVTVGPGLAPALEVGLNFAKNLALKLHKPLIAVNHLEGHLLSSLALPNTPGVGNSFTPGVNLKFPSLGLIASGGHTELVLIKKIGDYQLLGQTLDDACGEALDKLAKMLKLGYPGGPIIEQLAKQGNPNAIPLPVPMQFSKDLNFSFSGLKTAALYLIQRHTSEVKSSNTSEVKFIHDICASFQQAISISLCTKLNKAIKQYQPKAILLGGGVFSNLYLRRQIRQKVQPFGIPIYLPYSKKLYTDNAAMICIPAYYKYLSQDFVTDIPSLDRQPTLNF
ncbi:MAG: tRNA (adenosine(37)-N6)-threonylcarbamoyltransferase complex transferase subunit TsaD [Patescibacteria group bacterium]